MIDTIDSLMGAQRAFVADASHQLRTPLAALRLRFDNLLADQPDSESLLAAQLEVNRLAAIIDGLLSLARVDGTAVQPSTVDAADIARTRVETWSALAQERGINLRGDIAAGKLPAQALPGALEQGARQPH